MANLRIHFSDNENEESEITKHLDSNPINNNICNIESGSSSRKSDNHIKAKTGKEKEITKHRYAFQTRSQVDILDDGYRWRKYGQKTVKNSKFPSYYKCTQNGCNVKKQIQRNTNDEEIVVTTYEGIHTHPTQISTDNFEDIIIKQMQSYTFLSNAQSSAYAL
ncbi:probable WRKY transcription factor 75 isoform X2 [Jatropha curcas]|uniref:probable WRKY transcription factor 75 isoform X2 n=1 Tax=Jatropha curcas TaxID=180498 RepID=UPI0005FBC040|nr:probable WRKY transcription factor 75 isoform X2 [Jatropha curcas]